MHLLKILFLTVFAVYFTGCSGKPVSFTSVDPKLYTPIDQGIVIIDHSNSLVGIISDKMKNEEIKAFYDFILGKKAKKIFEDFGYLVK